MTECQLEILWEGEIQGYMLDKKRHWKPRTKLMKGALIQTSPEVLKLEMSMDVRRPTEKKSIPVGEEVDLSAVVFIGDQTGAKEFNFFCQCLRLNEDRDEEIVVHLFQTECDDLRRSFWEAILEFMRKKVATIPTCFFQVAVQKVDLEKGTKLLGSYTLRSSPSEIEFMIAENVPGVRIDQDEIASIKLLEDMRLDTGEHVIDLILKKTEAKRKQHIVITSKWGYLLLVYLKRSDLSWEDPQENLSIASLPLSPIHKRSPAIPPKPSTEDGPPLPPRIANFSAKGATLDSRQMRTSIGSGDTRTNPPLPPRNEKERSPSLPPRNDKFDKRGVTLPRNMQLSRTREIGNKLAPVPIPRKTREKCEAPQTEEVTEPNYPASPERKRLTFREPMPTPPLEDLSETLVSLPSADPHYADLDAIPSPRNRPQMIKLADSIHGYAEINWVSQNMETPLTDLIDENEFKFPENKAEKDDGGYLKLENYDGKVDAGGYLTIGEVSVEDLKSKDPYSSSASNTPIVPPRFYREFFNN